MTSLAEKISVIVPVFNGERYLAAALDSVLAQSLAPHEVIVVDDGSNDGTAEVLDRYAAHVRVVRQDNRGPAAARNTGLRLATSPLLAFLDADDIWLGNKLEAQAAALGARPELGFVLCHIENFWEPELGPVPESIRRHPASLPRPGYYFQAMLARRGVFDAAGELDESLRVGEDLDWFARATQAGIPQGMVTEVLVRRRIHGANLSGLGGGDADLHLTILQRLLQRRRSGMRPDLPTPPAELN